MPIALPDTFTVIVYGVVALIGIVGLVLAKTWLTPWLQKYQNSIDTSKNETDTTAIQKADAEENDESDKLKKIDGR